MKLTRRIKARSAPKTPKVPLVIYDETHSLFTPISGRRQALASMVQAQRRYAARSMLATQAVIKSTSGKRERFIGSTRWSDGAPLHAAPTKFLPAQVARKAAGL